MRDLKCATAAALFTGRGGTSRLPPSRRRRQTRTLPFRETARCPSKSDSRRYGEFQCRRATPLGEFVIAQVLLLIQIDGETWIEERVLVDATFGIAACIADDARASHPVVEAIVRVPVQPQVRLPYANLLRKI